MVIFGIITAVTIATTSYAFKDNKDEYYKVRISNIESNAKRYAMTLDEVKEEGSKIITVNDLVNNGYLSADNDKAYDNAHSELADCGLYPHLDLLPCP